MGFLIYEVLFFINSQSLSFWIFSLIILHDHFLELSFDMHDRNSPFICCVWHANALISIFFFCKLRSGCSSQIYVYLPNSYNPTESNCYLSYSVSFKILAAIKSFSRSFFGSFPDPLGFCSIAFPSPHFSVSFFYTFNNLKLLILYSLW